MIPLSDYAGFRKRFPIITVGLVAVNVLVFIYQLSLPQRTLVAFIQSYGAVPYELARGVDVPPFGPNPIYVTVFTSMFMHGGWLHIGSNMLYLWVFGDNVEDSMGHPKYFVFYLVCGVAAVAAQTFVDVSSRIPSVGASGAIAGVLGAYIFLHPQARVKVLVILGIFITVTELPSLIVIGFWALTQIFTGLASLGVVTHQTGGVAYFAHIGGFFAGLFLAPIFGRR
ncbi:MAG: rhomboid family intramembrane serine protease [Chloroflexi bacterium]|nr:rhomboid family intramembrane serine protease [Chloroflexota bacterium]